MVPPHLDHHLNADGSSLIADKDKILKRWAEHFDSVVTNPPPLTTRPLTVSHKFQSTRHWMPCQPLMRSSNQSVCCPVAKRRAQIRFQPRSTEGGRAQIEKLHQFFKLYGSMRHFRKTSRMPPSHIYTSGRETARPVTTTVEYPRCQSQARPWQECYSTGS